MHRGNYVNYCQTMYRNERIARSGVTRHQNGNRPYCRPALPVTRTNLRNDGQRKHSHENHVRYNNGFQNGISAIQGSIQIHHPPKFQNYQQYNNVNSNKNYDTRGPQRQSNRVDYNRSCRNYPNSANVIPYCGNRNAVPLLPPPPSLLPTPLLQPVMPLPLLPPSIPFIPQNLYNFISNFQGHNQNGVAIPAQVVPPIFPGLPQVDLHNLMSKLMEHNLINIPKPNHSFEKPPVKENPPMMSDFKIEKLKIKYKGFVDNLGIGIKCSVCYLTFKPEVNPKTGEQEGSTRYTMHLQKHFDNRKNPKPSSRAFFKSLKEWLSFECYNDATIPMEKTRHVEDIQKSDTTPEPLVTDEDVDEGLMLKSEVLDPICFVCQDGFDIVWSDDMDDWCWGDCYKRKDKVFHSTCLSDYKED